ncbi:ImmA/IrrE family metallo-endopeptidase [Embleya sp. NPDC005971]|uniref:ImmA/IrrE family metallo-endopeptidase n=1 Tax=Embleya sp. NPDC005971 TaxID=3156724 RepID=UPI0033DDFB78
MNWDVAHRIAGIAAAQAHRDLDVDRSTYVRVHGALGAAGLIGMAKSMPRLFGVYHSPDDGGPAVLLNARLDVITQRHTAAHELGHHRLAHRSAYDNELDASLRWGNGSWPDEEKVAEAFAAWFLMPRPAVLAALEQIAGGRPTAPEHAYLLARALGTSYTGTVRHLARLSQVDRGRAEQWLKITPATLKRSLTRGAAVSPDAHVHAVTTRMHGRRLHVDAADLLVLHPPGALIDRLPEALSLWPEPGDRIGTSSLEHPTILEVTHGMDTECRLAMSVPGTDEPLEVTLVRESPRSGIDEIWP